MRSIWPFAIFIIFGILFTHCVTLHCPPSRVEIQEINDTTYSILFTGNACPVYTLRKIAENKFTEILNKQSFSSFEIVHEGIRKEFGHYLFRAKYRKANSTHISN